ncbi:ROK family transcriptional regulator [Tessaracoccus rhinocerotis]|uniref:ROK family transcriptional regulator n=1 Tax=Tessaracoccus rhinocerotis TaxID=1689449 RepID=A0A553K4N4_9ACTN|nr:ROK family transcriptional regulator [Tessaracoccus rhinocerotis]TRY19675.1 ROK family transcriptional regulator [Tessaracoccus rhinocerotis]
MTGSKPGVPSLLRELNDSAALKHIMLVGGVTRSELAAHTGLSRVTSSQALARLEALGLISSGGRRPGARGPAAELYVLAPGVGCAVGVALYASEVRAELADLTGEVRAVVVFPLDDAPAAACAAAVRAVLAEAGEEVGPLLEVTVATPGVIDPATGNLAFAHDLATDTDLRGDLTKALGVPVSLGNDVHLAALAERRAGVAAGEHDFVLLWVGRGIGMASVIDGVVRVGSSGAAGEIGYLPVPGVPLPDRVDNLEQGSFQRVVGASAVQELAKEHGLSMADPDAVAASLAFVAELGRRIGLGVAAIGTIQDPSLFVLTGETVFAAGPLLPAAVADAVSRIAPVHPRVELAALALEGPVRGAVLHAVEEAREVLMQRLR